MGIHYQAFNCKLIILYITFIVLGVCYSGQVLAYDSLFTVKNVEVDVTSENSVSAQNEAFNKAQIIAFRILAKRMVEEAQVESVATPNSLTISSLIKDYEVTDESLSAVRYVGTYIFRFREAAVSKFFSVSGVQFTDKSSKPLLILPIFQKDGKNMLWSEGNIWMQAWGRSQNSGGLVPVEVPIGDLMDISDVDESNALSYERLKLDRMLGRYNAKEAAIMIAVPDINLAGVSNGNSKAIGKMRVSIYRTDRARAEHVRDINVKASSRETLGQLYDRAVSLAYKALQNDWKNKTLSSASQGQVFIVQSYFKNIKQWMRTRKALENLSGVANISIVSMSKKSAVMSLKFRGDEKYLRDTLSRSNMYLGQGRAVDNSSKILYDIGFGRKPVQSKSALGGATDGNVFTF